MELGMIGFDCSATHIVHRIQRTGHPCVIIYDRDTDAEYELAKAGRTRKSR
jgi:6-phosphogluconate dehydrogenase (decarboxylating)